MLYLKLILQALVLAGYWLVVDGSVWLMNQPNTLFVVGGFLLVAMATFVALDTSTHIWKYKKKEKTNEQQN